MSDAGDAYPWADQVKRIVDQAPPFSPAQEAKLWILLKPMREAIRDARD